MPGPRPGAAPPRPTPDYGADAEDKTSALDISSLGLDADEATTAADGSSLRARAAAAPADDEKTTAFSLADLPPDDEPRRPAQKTILGHPAPRASGGPVRGGASAQPPRPAAPPTFEEEKTTAMSLADIDKIDALPPRPAPKPGLAPGARPAPAQQSAAPAAKPAPARPPAHIAEDERTMAVNLDDLAKVEAARTGGPSRPMPSHIAEDERTMAVNLDDVKLNELPRKPAALAKAAAKAPARAPDAELSDEKTTAMSLDDIEKLEVALPRRRAEAAPAQAPAKQAARGPEMSEEAGFGGDIAYALEHDAVEAQLASGKASGVGLDAGRRAAGYRNLIIVGVAVAAIITVVGLIW